MYFFILRLQYLNAYFIISNKEDKNVHFLDTGD